MLLSGRMLPWPSINECSLSCYHVLARAIALGTRSTGILNSIRVVGRLPHKEGQWQVPSCTTHHAVGYLGSYSDMFLSYPSGDEVPLLAQYVDSIPISSSVSNYRFSFIQLQQGSFQRPIELHINKSLDGRESATRPALSPLVIVSVPATQPYHSKIQLRLSHHLHQCQRELRLLTKLLILIPHKDKFRHILFFIGFSNLCYWTKIWLCPFLWPLDMKTSSLSV